jgi:hypothetical protein
VVIIATEESFKRTTVVPVVQIADPIEPLQSVTNAVIVGEDGILEVEVDKILNEVGKEADKGLLDETETIFGKELVSDVVGVNSVVEEDKTKVDGELKNNELDRRLDEDNDKDE